MMKVKNDEADCRVGCALLGTAMVGVVGIQGSREEGVDVEGERARCASNSVQWATESGPVSAISEPIKSKYSLRAGTLATASQVTSISDEMSWDV